MIMRSAEDLRWEARDDARILARAEEIKADKERHARAIEGAEEIAKEEMERVKGILKVAGEKSPKASAERGNVPNFGGKANRRNNPATLGRL